MLQALLDGDILCYELGFASETGWEDSQSSPPFSYVEEMLLNRIGNICAMANAESPIIFFTGNTNFRTEIAKTQPYKNRAGKKPWHYYNIKEYLKAVYEYRIQEGLEADDLLAIEQTKRPLETIICSRDKDLKQVPGWHYGWEVHNQPSFGPLLVNNPGSLKLSEDRTKLEGYGDLFFYGQCLTGDKVDTVPGLGGKLGAVGASKILDGCTDSQDAFNRVREAYRGLYGDVDGDARLLEQGRLLYMIRELNEDGSPRLWEFPFE